MYLNAYSKELTLFLNRRNALLVQEYYLIIQWLPKLPGQEISRGLDNKIIFLKTISDPYLISD
jgi:hypothetical protein